MNVLILLVVLLSSTFSKNSNGANIEENAIDLSTEPTILSANTTTELFNLAVTRPNTVKDLTTGKETTLDVPSISSTSTTALPIFDKHLRNEDLVSKASTTFLIISSEEGPLTTGVSIFDRNITDRTETGSFPSEKNVECDEKDIPTVTNFIVTPSNFGAKITWDEVTECISNYIIYLDDKETIPNLSPTTTTTDINDLDACTEYKIAIAVSYNGNPGKRTENTIKTTEPSEIQDGVENLNLNATKTSLIITWDPLKDRIRKCSTGYRVQWWGDGDDHIPPTVTIDTQKEECILSPIIGCLKYFIMVKSVFGNKESRNENVNYTADPAPTTAPIFRKPFKFTDTQVTINWRVGDEIQIKNVCPLKEIVLDCKAFPIIEDACKHTDRIVKDPIEKKTGNHQTNITDLSPFTKYDCSGYIVNSGGNSEPATFSFQTPQEVPGKPGTLQVNNVQATWFEVTWSKPECTPGILLNYTISILNKGPQYTEYHCTDQKPDLHVTLGPEEQTFNYTDASPYYLYEISVLAIDAVGDGSPEKITQITLTAEPDPVNNLKIEQNYVNTRLYNNTALVDFEQPCETNGPFVRYDLSINECSQQQKCLPFIQNTTTTQFSVPLKPYYNYNFEVTVVTRDFKQAIAYNGTFRSYPGVPDLGKPMDAPLSNETTRAFFSFSKNAFNESNGAVLYYSLLLLKGVDRNGADFGYWNDEDDSSWPRRDAEIQLTEFKWHPFGSEATIVEWVIGSDYNCTQKGFCNKALEADTNYTLIVRALTSRTFLDSSPLYFKTASKILDDSNLGLILGLIFGILGLLALIGFLLFMWKRHKKQKPLDDQFAKSLTPTAISYKRFLEHYKYLEQNPLVVTEQFSKLHHENNTDVLFEKTFAVLPENRRKNRYKNILPFDHTRVKLQIDEDDEIASDYINASYIKGYHGKVEYIATQGPLDSTANDFWKMIIQENVTVIVMVAQFIENDKNKVYQYFPNNHESMIFGDKLEVKCFMELHFGRYCVRTLHVRKDNVQHTVLHMQYLEWPDFDVPSGSDCILQLCSQIREKIAADGGLIVMHCSAGVGRTGTLIATDMLLQAVEDRRDIDVFGTVLELRQQRSYMVQTQKQYWFIHTCIRDSFRRPITPSAMIEVDEIVYENMSIITPSKNEDADAKDSESAL